MFSTFPDGWPGRGLLLLRVAGSVPLFVAGMSRLWGEPGDVALGVQIFSCTTGVLMLAGLWTPLAASFQAILAGMFAISGPAFDWTHLIHASMGLSLVMLGPGYWSIDARHYGRKRIDLNPLARPSERDPEDS